MCSYFCRICLDFDQIDNLTSPCRCSGTLKYVHRHCFDIWKNINANNDKYYKCEICNENYNIVDRYSIPWIKKWLHIIGYSIFIIIHLCQILFSLVLYYHTQAKLLIFWIVMITYGIIRFYNQELKPLLVK